MPLSETYGPLLELARAMEYRKQRLLGVSSSRYRFGRAHLRMLVVLSSALLLAACASAPSTSSTPSTPLASSGNAAIPGVTPSRLTAEHWISRLHEPAELVLDSAAIAAQNRRLTAQDRAVHDLTALPQSMSAEEIINTVKAASSRPQRTLFDTSGAALSAADIDGLMDALALDDLSSEVTLRFGLVTRRSDLRGFPTTRRVFSSPDNTDIDRFQESALFPGTPVAVLHESRDGQWWFVTSRLYSAWIQAGSVAIGSRENVFTYVERSPYLIVTGAQARTVFTPEAPQVSDLVLDMGVRVPLIDDWPSSRLVNGQLPFASHVVALPVHGEDGQLDIVPALVPRNADVATNYLPLTRANLISQAFKFLGERYGWGHSYGTRDCSGFVSEIYRSFGVEMPRNTSDQGVTTAFDRIAFKQNDTYEQRVAVLRTLDVGDLIYIPGHVMMVIGHEDGETWLIHDTTGMHYRDAAGVLTSVSLNQVSVTPLYALLGESGTPYVDFIYSIQRIRTVEPE